MTEQRPRNLAKPAKLRSSLARVFRLAVLIALLAVASACASQSGPNSAVPSAAGTARLWWLAFALAVVIYAVGIALLLRWRYAAARETEPGRRPPRTRAWIVLGGIFLSTLLLALVYLYAVRTLDVMAASDGGSEDTIEIVGHPWWWEVRYGNGVISANEVHIPVGQDVQLRISAAGVSHGLWVPGLMSSVDYVPGRTNSVWLHANQPGEYLSECAGRCGSLDAQMRLLVVAEPEPNRLAWMAKEQTPAATPSNAREFAGQQVFLGSACVYCHRIDGTNATGDIGPDLTHLASRRMLGAGIMPNVPGNLAGWIVNSQALKPGNRMPPMYIDAKDMDPLLAYLESLH